MDTATLYRLLAFAAGLAATLALSSRLTPPHWWRRPTARGLAVLAAGTWALGGLIALLVPDPLSASTAASLAPPAAGAAASADPMPVLRDGPGDAPRTAAAIPGRPFQVHRDLNLRAAAGIHAARLVTVPAGASVTPTGLRDGDWWQVRARVAGRDSTGWVSSLWLRRSGE